MTWLRHNHGGYTVFFNRDEQRTRAQAFPPREAVLNGVRFLSPVDGAAGGTWLAASERGITLALLNFYEAEHRWRSASPQSRGRLIPSLIHEPDIDGITRRVRDIRCENFHPFILVAFDARRAEEIRGRHSRDIEHLLGARGRAEMIHRDDMTLNER